MNKHAYMIIAHGDVEHLIRLVNALDDIKNDIYIHIDKSKYKFLDISRLKTWKASLKIYSKIAVHWGSFSMVECELLLLKEAAKKHHSYYHLLSGADYPIKNIDEIYNFFEHSQKEFVLFTNSFLYDEYGDWVYKYHIFNELYKRSKYKIINKLIFEADNFFVKLQRIVHFKRAKHFKLYQKGSQWFSITEEFAKYVLSFEDIIRKDFRYTFTPDEMFIQTLIINSSFFERIYNYKDFNNCIQNMRMIDWNRGLPYVFRYGDFEELKCSKCMFARKFSTLMDCRIINKLEGFIRN